MFKGTKDENAAALEKVTAVMLAWHERLTSASGTAQSFLMPLEDFTPERATQMAKWLGFDCVFDALPHANDDGGMSTDYENVNVTCAAGD